MSKVEDTQKPSFTSKAKPVLMGLFAAGIAGVAVYALGWWQGQATVDSGKQQVETIKQELQTSQQQVNTFKNRGYLMQARAALFNAAVDLDQRNFGVANLHLQEAANALAQVKENGNKINLVKLGELQKKISQTNINVAINLEEQRQKVLAFVNDLNSLIPDELKKISESPAK